MNDAETPETPKVDTPLMRQYAKIKGRHPNAILLFRMGDFYETFEEDARIVSRELGITLTKRANGQAGEVPLAGFPHHALDNYLPRLVQAGHRVAVCEQLEDPKFARKIVKRDVVEVVTPGVSFHDNLLSPRRSNYLAAVVWGADRSEKDLVGLAFVDISTGEFSLTECAVGRTEEVLQAIGPAELLVDRSQRERLNAFREPAFVVTPQEDWAFSREFAQEVLLRHFRTHSLKGFGVEDLGLGIRAAGAVLNYLNDTQKGKLPHIRRITRFANDDYIALDPATRRNLELVSSMQGAGQEGTLVQILDETLTPMGARLLRKWLLRPLRSVPDINRRLDAVQALVESRRLREKLREELRQVGDLERLAARLCVGRATPRDLINLKLTLRQIPAIKSHLAGHSCETLRKIGEKLTLCQAAVERIERALCDEPPASLAEGGYIRGGYHPELDELRELARSGKDWVVRMQKKEAERCGIPSLKVGFNRVFGYYIEITNTHKKRAPEDYIRKQTLVNSERYITPELKEYEEKILTAEEKIVGLEQELLNELRMIVAEETGALQGNAALLAMADCFGALAEAAVRYGYHRPEVDDGLHLDIENGRHPVVERFLPPGEPFIPNSIRLDPAGEQIALITGPNMAGKSVILRQTALIVLLAQVGSFVPADRARVGVVDRIFTRVGASDNLAAGESTFLVEMNETANILNNASPRSLILLDEVGRGTSTFDGLSIAWAIVEYLHETPAVAARTLFATHYHELNELAARYGRIANYRVQVQEHEGKVIFLRSLAPGSADHSYGIEVARMAGLPVSVIERARQILRHLEKGRGAVGETTGGDDAPAGNLPLLSGLEPIPTAPPSDPLVATLREMLAGLDVNRLTPIEALIKLSEIKEALD